jgi:hypothetical protein
MRLLVWILGVICTLAALMNAYAVAPRWVWVFWFWLVLWGVVGVAYLIAVVARLVVSGGKAARATAPSPPGLTGKERDLARE